MVRELGSNNNNLEYQVYLEERKSLIDAEFEESRLFDKAILSLSAGAFGLSLTFVRQITPQTTSWTLIFLGLAWFSFCVSMLSTLISFLTSQHACSRQREILEQTYFPTTNGQDKKTTFENKPAIWTKRLNKGSIISFIIGATLLAIFSIVNLLS